MCKMGKTGKTSQSLNPQAYMVGQRRDTIDADLYLAKRSKGPSWSPLGIWGCPVVGLVVRGQALGETQTVDAVVK